MKKLIFATIMLFAITTISAQNEYENIIEGDIFKDQTNWTQVSFFEGDGNGGYVILRTFHIHSRSEAEAYYLEHYDSELKLIKRVKINEDKVSSRIIIDNGVINMITFNLNKATKAYEFNLFSSSLKTMRFKKKKLCSTGKNEKLGTSLYSGDGTFDSNSFGAIYFSENKNFIALTFDVKNKEEATHQIFVFNKKFEKVNEYTFKKNIQDKFFDFESVSVDDKNGDILILGKVFRNNSRKVKKDDKVNYHYELFKLTDNNQEKLDLQINNNFVKSIETVRNGNTLSFVGFYGKNKEEKSIGICKFDIDIENFSLRNSSFSKFSNQLIIEKFGKKSDKELKNLEVNNLYIEDNGDVIVTAEESYMEYPKGGIRFHYDNIIVIKLDRKGELIWARDIDKEQIDTYYQVSNTVHASYGSLIKNNKVYFFFNASPKTKNSKDGTVKFEKFKRKNSAVYCLILDENGKSSYKKIYEDEDLDILFHTEDMLIDDKENIILFGDYKREKRFLNIKY